MPFMQFLTHSDRLPNFLLYSSLHSCILHKRARRGTELTALQHDKKSVAVSYQHEAESEEVQQCYSGVQSVRILSATHHTVLGLLETGRS